MTDGEPTEGAEPPEHDAAGAPTGQAAIDAACFLLRQAVDAATETMTEDGDPSDFLGLKKSLDTLARDRVRLYRALGSPAAEAIEKAHTELKPVDIIRSVEEFERIAPLDDFRMIPAIVVDGHHIDMSDFPEAHASFYARLAVLGARGIDLNAAVDFFDFDDKERNHVSWNRLRNGLTSGNASDSIMDRYLRREADPLDFRNKILYLEAPAELPDDPRIRQVDSQTQPNGIVIGSEYDQSERKLYTAKQIKVDGHAIPLDNLQNMRHVYFIAKWALLTAESENDADRVFTTLELREVATSIAEGEQAQKQFVLYALKRIQEGTHGHSVLTPYVTQRMVKNSSGRIRTLITLLAAPEKAEEYWAAFLDSDRIDQDRLTGINPERAIGRVVSLHPGQEVEVTVAPVAPMDEELQIPTPAPFVEDDPLPDSREETPLEIEDKESSEVPIQTTPANADDESANLVPQDINIKERTDEADYGEPTLSTRDLDDGLIIRRGETVELLLDDEPTSLSPLAALLVEALADHARVRSSSFSLHDTFEAAVAELGLTDEIPSEVDIHREVRIFLKANDLDYLL